MKTKNHSWEASQSVQVLWTASTVHVQQQYFQVFLRPVSLIGRQLGRTVQLNLGPRLIAIHDLHLSSLHKNVEVLTSLFGEIFDKNLIHDQMP